MESKNRKKKPKPSWYTAAKIAMVERDIGVTELAEAIGYSREHTSSVLNGGTISFEAEDRICAYLGVRIQSPDPLN